MARTSRGKGSPSRGAGARGSAKRAAGGAKKKAAARGRSGARSAARTATKKSTAAKARGGATAKPAAKRASTGGGAEVAKLKARFEREKGGLEKRLTESVREIGQLRHHEARVGQLERQLKERDDTITKLRGELSELRRRPAVDADDPAVQPSLALGERAPRDLDDFDDEMSLDDDDELV